MYYKWLLLKVFSGISIYREGDSMGYQPSEESLRSQRQLTTFATPVMAGIPSWGRPLLWPTDASTRPVTTRTWLRELMWEQQQNKRIGHGARRTPQATKKSHHLKLWQIVTTQQRHTTICPCRHIRRILIFYGLVCLLSLSFIFPHPSAEWWGKNKMVSSYPVRPHFTCVTSTLIIIAAVSVNSVSKSDHRKCISLG